VPRSIRAEQQIEVSPSIMLDAHCEDALLRVASQPLRDIIVLMRDTGMRNERELYCLRVESIDWRTRMIVVPTSKTHIYSIHADECASFENSLEKMSQ